MPDRPAPPRVIALLALLLLAVLGVSIFLGRYPAPYWMSPARLASDPLARQLVWSLRLPRLLTALLLGMTLSAAGLVMQMIFRNPLVEPGFLGVTHGAAFGAALCILCLRPAPVAVEVSATLFGLAGLWLTYLFARWVRFGGWVLRLVLAGIAVSALFSSGTGILKYLADPLTQLPEITFWMLGGLYGVTWRELLYVLPLCVPALAVLYLMRWRLNLLSLSDDTAFSLGTAPGRERAALLVVAVVATGALTAVSGVVGWVGLIVPHIARRLCGASARHTMPASMLLGGVFVVACDDLARVLLPGEIPLGILTALVGSVGFLALLTHATPRLKP
jgi:iron complex transport system permease protein